MLLSTIYILYYSIASPFSGRWFQAPSRQKNLVIGDHHDAKYD